MKDRIIQKQTASNGSLPTLKVFLGAFFLKEYFASPGERVEEIEDYLSPYCSQPLQLMIDDGGCKELHLINCPANMLLDEVIAAYLKCASPRQVN